MYIYKNEALKKLELDLKFRECVLVNELDILFFDLTQFPLSHSRESASIRLPLIPLSVVTFRTLVMEGFNHLASVAFNRLQGRLFRAV